MKNEDKLCKLYFVRLIVTNRMSATATTMKTTTMKTSLQMS